MKSSISADRPRVLVIFGNIPLLGQERGNIQVFKALENDVDALFVTHKRYGHEIIQPTLNALGLRWTAATYVGLFSRGMRWRTWLTRLRELVTNNWEFLRIARAYRPTHIHVGNERHLLNLLPAVWLVRAPIVFRLGDKPREHLPLFRFLWRNAIAPLVSQFVCVSEFIRREAIKVGVPERKARVVYSYPSVRPPISEQDRVRIESFHGSTILYMGQLSEEKGVGHLIEAAIDLCQSREDIRFLLAGDYTWQNPFAEALMERVQTLGLSDRIQFLGYVNDVPGLLALADVHVCPSICEEALSNTVVEAKQAGVPSVIFASGGLPELITHGQDGYVCPTKTPKALREGVEHFLKMNEEDFKASVMATHASLGPLGITMESFTRAWREVYESV